MTGTSLAATTSPPPWRRPAPRRREALFNYGKDKPVGRDEKFKAYVLCQRIIQGGGILEVTTEEGTLIKEVCGESLTAGGYGQVYELIEGGV